MARAGDAGENRETGRRQRQELEHGREQEAELRESQQQDGLVAVGRGACELERV